jgi:predicted acetyltransferase
LRRTEIGSQSLNRSATMSRMSNALPHLGPPTVEVRESFLAAVMEFRSEAGDLRTVEDRELEAYGAEWFTPAGFAALVDALCAEARDDTPRPAGRVPQTNLWWMTGTEYYGRLSVRHRLTPTLREVGGHIGYAVRPTARRHGHATAMLRDGLGVAHDLGIDPALVTCDADNIGSRRVIEHNGGVLEDRRGEKLRFWLPTQSIP